MDEAQRTDDGLNKEPLGAARLMSAFGPEIDELKGLRRDVVQRIQMHAPEHSLVAHQIDWHLRGLEYHLRHLYEKYAFVGREVSGRAGNGADVIVMHSPEMQDLTIEFVAFMNLARIALDQLRNFIEPSRKNIGSLPNSIRDLIKVPTDHPVLLDLAARDQPLLLYLIDLRDCLTHHRTFATSDNTVAVREGFDDPGLLQQMPWFRPVTRVIFRVETEHRIVVNILLPDQIYNTPGSPNSGFVSPFTYTMGINVLTQTREFSRFLSSTLLQTLARAAAGDRFTVG